MYPVQRPIENVATLVKNEDFDKIIFTLDWHPFDHCSFISSGKGGEWPDHCINYSIGSTISHQLLEAFKEKREGVIQAFLKGVNSEHEEYGAFEIQGELRDLLEEEAPELINLVEDKPGFQKGYHPGTFILKDYDRSSAIDLMELGEVETNQVIVCGVAGDFCVLETIKNLKRVPKEYISELSVYLPGIASIDGGKKLSDYLNDNPDISKYGD